MSTDLYRYIVIRRHGGRSPADQWAEAECFANRVDMIDAIADTETCAVDADVIDVFLRNSGDVLVMDRDALDSECEAYIEEIHAERRHRAQERRAYREAAL